jgi:hypothetical protein
VEREQRTTAVIVAAFVALRLTATLGADIGISADSPTYFDFDLWGGIRFPVMTAFYSLVDNHRAIVTIQAIVGAACWATAAVLLASLLERATASVALLCSLLVLGLTTPVTRFDNSLLSESIAISVSVVLTALLIRLSCRSTRATAIALIGVVAVWVFVRQSNAIVVVLVLLALIVVRTALPRQLAWKLAGSFAVLAVVGLLLAASDSTVQEHNVAQILQRRIIGESSDERWFVDRGMPSNGRQVLRAPVPEGIPPAARLMGDERFRRWIGDEGMSEYARFLVTHPAYVVTTLVDDRYPAGAFFGGATGSVDYGSTRAVLPDIVESVFWQQSRADALVAVLVLVPVVGVAASRVVRERRLPPGGAMALGLLVVCAVNVAIVAHTAGAAYPRLLMATGASARVAVLWLLVAAIAMPRTTRERVPA